MTRHFIATFILVNGLLAVALGIFYQLVLLCADIGFNPWVASAAFLLACAFGVWRMERGAVTRWRAANQRNAGSRVLHLYETRNLDSHGE